MPSTVKLICIVDDFDLSTSFPLSRFVQGMDSFNVGFAVRGANSASKLGLVYFLNKKTILVT